MNMIITAGAIAIGMGMVAPLVIRRLTNPKACIRVIVGSLLGVNGLTLVACVAAILMALTVPTPVLAAAEDAAQGLSGAALGAALSTGLACIGAGIAVGIAGAAAIGGITEKPEILGRTLIFVGLAEGIAIYGLIISFMILNA